jgi:hypothetical protein
VCKGVSVERLFNRTAQIPAKIEVPASPHAGIQLGDILEYALNKKGDLTKVAHVPSHRGLL